MKGNGTLIMLAILVLLVAGLSVYSSTLDHEAYRKCIESGYSGGYEQLVTGHTYCFGVDGAAHKIE